MSRPHHPAAARQPGRPQREQSRARGLSDIRRLYDEAMARAAGRAPQPLQRYLAVLVTPR